MPPKTKIFIGKLPDECSEQALLKLFERHGEVTECSVLGNFAFVHMKTEAQSQEAIRALNNYNFQGSNISVEQSTGEKRDGGFRGGFRGGRGRGGPMRGGRGGGMRPSPYDRPPHQDRYGGPPPMSDRYGPLPPPRPSYYDEYDRPLRRPMPPGMGHYDGPMHMERRAPPPDPYARDPYDRYDPYDRMAVRRSPPAMMERRAPPPPPMGGYERRPVDPYADLYRDYAALPRELPPPPRRY